MATPGDRIDKFTLVRQLGAGGMGTTWEAVRQAGHEFEQRVAIKLADPEWLKTRDGLDSFRREAALAASLRHPNIAAVLDIDDRAGYIVCELVDGADLRAVLRAMPGGRLEPELTVHVLGQIARGLSHAHRRILRGRSSPVVHRDMSPGNVVIDYDGNVKIVDFGIAKAMLGGSDTYDAFKGKLAYVAPEQAMGNPVDGRADQYALGVIAYEALSGARPNDGAHEGETLACILEGKHIPLAERVSDLPARLTRVVERMLALRPEERFPTMEALLDALAEHAPRLTIYRSLVPLVIAARQPHTIVRENGRFISQPVEAEPLLRGLLNPTAPPLAMAMQGQERPRARSLAATLDEAPAYVGDGQVAAGQTRGHGFVQSLRVTLGASPAEAVGRGRVESGEHVTSPVDDAPAPRKRSDSSEHRVRLDQRVDEASQKRRRAASEDAPDPRMAGLQAHRRARDAAPVAQSRRSVVGRVLDSRLFWRMLTGLGVVLLGLVIWLAFSPELLQRLVPPAPTPAPSGSSSAAEGGNP